MSGRTSGVLLLLLIMLNHAVMACDALVVHMPDHDHAYTNSIDNHHITSNVTGDAEHHNEHAHVTCYISFFSGIELLNFSGSAIVGASHGVNLISYRPPVPPPNV